MITAAVERVSLGQLIKVKHGFAFKGTGFRSEPTSHLLITPGNFAIGGGFQFRSERETYFAGDVPQDYVLSAGDLVVTMTDLSKEGDTLGFPALIPETQNLAFLHNQRIGLVQLIDRSRSDARYLYYLMCSREYRDEILASATGSTVKHTAPSRIEAFRFDLPGLDKQRAIARILGALDDKIELNRRMNRTLEALAQKLFKSWFVDFDPVLAKSQNREPFGLADDIAALFPDAFEDSELGSIPKGWRVAPLGDSLEMERNLVDPQETPNEEFDHYSIPAFDSGQRPTRELGSAIKSGKYLVQGDVILLSKLNPETPRVWWPDADSSRRAIASTEFLICRGKGKIDRTWLYWQLRDSDFLDEFATRVTGTSNSHQRVRPDDLLRLVRVDAGAGLRDIFAVLVDASTKRMIENARQSQKLAALRDLLLPKLLSGEIRVPVAGKAVETVI